KKKRPKPAPLEAFAAQPSPKVVVPKPSLVPAPPPLLDAQKAEVLAQAKAAVEAAARGEQASMAWFDFWRTVEKMSPQGESKWLTRAAEYQRILSTDRPRREEILSLAERLRADFYKDYTPDKAQLADLLAGR